MIAAGLDDWGLGFSPFLTGVSCVASLLGMLALTDLEAFRICIHPRRAGLDKRIVFTDINPFCLAASVIHPFLGRFLIGLHENQ
jgi:hypothetical protein